MACITSQQIDTFWKGLQQVPRQPQNAANKNDNTPKKHMRGHLRGIQKAIDVEAAASKIATDLAKIAADTWVLRPLAQCANEF
jgi:hypothetical protein